MFLPTVSLMANTLDQYRRDQGSITPDAVTTDIPTSCSIAVVLLLTSSTIYVPAGYSDTAAGDSDDNGPVGSCNEA